MSELKDILEVNDFTSIIINPATANKKPTRAFIEAVLVLNNIPLPLPQSVSFVMISSNRAHTVRYGKNLDEYYTILMELAA